MTKKGLVQHLNLQRVGISGNIIFVIFRILLLNAFYIILHSDSFFSQVANLACSMSSNEDGVKMVRLAAAELENLCPQVHRK